jgi:hypothetical protein
MRGAFASILLLLFWQAGYCFSFSGEWDCTLQLLPTLSFYGSSLTLQWRFLPGWYLESTSTFASTGLRYQDFYVSGFLGDFSCEGKIYFHAEEVRYRRAWAKLSWPLSAGTVEFSANHWSSSAEYTSDHKETYGPWPCVNVIPWEEAWCHVGRTLYVYGPVAGYEKPSYLKLYIGRTDFYRFEVYISASYLPNFEAAFGKNFWETWAKENRVICVYGEIKDYRYTTDGGYSVPQISLSSTANISVRGCCGFPARTICPANLIRWFEAKNHVGETVYVQGPIVSYASSNTILRIGGGGTVPNRLEIYYAPGFPEEFRSRFSVGKFVCVYGTISLVGGVARIVVDDLTTFPICEGSCCGAELLPGQFLNWRAKLQFDPWTFTVDFGDCSTGTVFRRAQLAWEGLPFLCCGLFLDGSLTFTKCFAWEGLSFVLRDLFLPCCGITAKISGTLALDSLSLSFEPSWRGISGCFTIYGGLSWLENVIRGIEVYGWSISCYAGNAKLRIVTALDPDEVEDRTDITFYSGEWEYFGLTYSNSSSGELEFTVEFWFGEKGMLFGVQRFKFDLEIPFIPTTTLNLKGQWNFTKPSALDWLDLGWEAAF